MGDSNKVITRRSLINELEGLERLIKLIYLRLFSPEKILQESGKKPDSEKWESIVNFQKEMAQKELEQLTVQIKGIKKKLEKAAVRTRRRKIKKDEDNTRK